MNENEKQLIKDLFTYIEFFHYRVKVHDDVLQRVLINNPDLIPADLMSKIEDGNRKIAELNLEGIKERIKDL